MRRDSHKSPSARSVPFIILALATASISQVASAQESIASRVGREAIPRQVSYAEFEITSVDPAQSIEFRPLQVGFKLTPRLIGVAGTAPAPSDLQICPRLVVPDKTNCFNIRAAQANSTYRGQITAVAPAAASVAKLEVVAYKVPTGPGEVYQNAEVATAARPMTTSATYDIAIDRYYIGHTRSAREDTVRITLQGMVKSQPPHVSDSEDGCSLAGIHWCAVLEPQGDHSSGWETVNNVRVGPFELVPEKEIDLRFLFGVMNLGDTFAQQVGEEVANGFATAGMVILGAYGAAQGSSSTGSFATQLNSAMERLHGAEFAGCDGPLAVDRVVLSNRTIDSLSDSTLEALTRRSGQYTQILPANSDAYHEKDGNTRCGAGGEYRVSYIVYRTSWQPWHQ